MNPRCAAVITEAAKRLGKSVNLRDMEAKIRDMSAGVRNANPEAWRGMTQAQRMEQVGAALAREIQHQAARDATNTARNLSLAAKNTAYIDEAFTKEKGFMPLIRRIGRYMDNRGNVQSLESRAQAIANEHYASLKPLIELENAHLLFSDPAQTKMVIDEFHGKNTGNSDAKKAAEAIKSSMDSIAKSYNQWGGDIRLLDKYLPQAQDQLKLLRAKDEWIADASQRLDLNKVLDTDGNPLTGEKLRKFLEEAYWNNATDGIGKKKGEISQFGANQAVANRHKSHRQLHWKDADAWWYMQQKYGSGSLLDQITAHIDKLSHEIAMMENFGSNPLHAIDVLKQYTEEKVRAHGMELNGKELEKYVNQVNRQRTQLETMVDIYSGINNGVSGQAWVHRFFSNIRSLNVFDKLGSLPFAQLADNGTAIATARALNIPIKQLMEMKQLGYTDEQFRRIAANNAIAFDIGIDNMLRLGDTSNATSIPGQLAKLTMRITGANFTTKHHRMSFAALVEKNVGDLSRRYSWNELPEGDRRVYESRGITERDWNIYRAATPDQNYGMVGMKQINDIDSEQIKQFIPDEIARIRKDAADFIQRMEAQNQKEAGWVQGRQQKFAEFKAKIQKLIDDYIRTREKRVSDYSSMNLKREGELLIRLEQAEIDSDISVAAIAEKDAGRSAKFMEDVKRGMEWYGRRRSEIGEKLGAKRHSAKLQAAAADRAYTKLSEALIAKKNELFGPERVEDGFVVIGKVTKAANDLDAYAAKKEEQIQSAKTTGQVDKATSLKEDARIEFEAIKQSADNAIAELKSSVIGEQMEIRGLIDAIEAKKIRAEAEADIASYIQTEKSLEKIQGLLDTLDVRRGESADRMFSKGEALGYRKAMVEARLKQMKKREEAYAKQADKEVFSKATEFEKRIDQQLSELEDFATKFDEKAKERNQWAKEYEAKIGAKIEEAAELARRDAHLKLTGIALEEAETAVLQPSLYSRSIIPLRKGEWLSELGASLFQFKTFSIAMWQQHMIQRAQMFDGAASQNMYRLQLLALTSLFGGIGLYLSDIAAGKDPRKIYDENDSGAAVKFGMEAILKGGGLHVFGDLLNVATTEGRRDPMRMLSGPTVGMVGRGIELAQEGLQEGKDILSGNNSHNSRVAKKAIDFANEFVGLDSLLWTRAVYNNYLMAELNEWAAPGYKDRMRQSNKKNYSSEYWMGMGNEPRLPNFVPVGH